jgi:hypothetical protein
MLLDDLPRQELAGTGEHNRLRKPREPFADLVQRCGDFF